MARANEIKIEQSKIEAQPAVKPVVQPAKIEPAQPKPIMVYTVYGDMLDLTTNIWYTKLPKEVIRITPWMQSQLDAKKMEVM